MLFYCGNQWGYTPVGKVLNIPTTFCNPPLNLKATVYAQYATLSWDAPHDYLKFVVEYRILLAPTWTAVDVFGQSYMLTLAPNTVYQWRVKTVCATAPLRESIEAFGGNFQTGAAVAGCTPVTNVVVQYLGDRYKLSWIHTGAAYYTVEVKLVTAQTPRIYNTQATFIEIMALTPGEVYEARVIAHCQDTSMTPVPSPWVQWTIANMSCPAPGNITHTKGTTSIMIGWTSAGPGLTYNIYLNDVPVIIGFPGTTWTFSNLTPYTDYNIKVATNCGDGVSPAQEINVKTDATLCNPPTALQIVTASITPTGFDIIWVPGAGIASQQVILNNSAPIPLGAAIAAHSFTGLTAGSLNSVVVRSVCTNNVSTDASVSLQLAGCAPVTGLVLTPKSNSIEATWNPVANAVKYRISAVKVSDSSTAYAGTVFSTFAVFPLLEPLTAYTISVTTECAAGLLATPVTAPATTLAVPGCVNAIIDTQLVASTTIDILTWHFADGRTTGFFEYRLIRVSDSAQLANGQMSNIMPISFTNLTPATAYKVYIFDKGASDNLACTPTEVATITTAITCAPPTNVVAALQTNDTQILITATASVSAPPNYEVEYQAGNSTVWVNVGAHTLPYTITPVAPGKYKVRLRSNCPASASVWAESNYTCPKPVVTSSTVVSNGIHIEWTPLVGIAQYSVSLYNNVTQQYSYHGTSDAFIDIANLTAGVTYTAMVSSICDAAGNGVNSDPFNFVAGQDVPGRIGFCPDPIFTAYAQDCGVTDPGGIGGGDGGPPIDGGGGGGVGADCNVTAQDWALVNALFADVADDAPNDTFLEATFEIAQSIGNGILAAMPGGIMGVINAACLPASTASVGIEVVLGGTLEVGAGTYATNGNITVAGSYTSDGSTRLVVRLRGNYNKV